MKKLLVVFLCLAGGALFAQTAAGQAQEARTALLIANGAYTSFSSLANPVPEARQLKTTLEGLGFQVTLVTDASKERMQEAILDFESTLKRRGGIAFFHYGGHAVQVQGRNWLIPATANIQDEARVRIHAVEVEEITTTLEASGASTSIVILDSCRDNPLPAGSGRSATRGLTVLGANPRNSIVVYSAQAGSTARDGVFTPALIRSLSKPLSFTEVVQEVRREVNAATNGQQTPGAYDQLFTPVYLAGRPSTPAPATPANPAAPAVTDQGRVRFESPIPGLVYLGEEIIGEVGPDRPLAAEGLPIGRQEFQFVSNDGSLKDSKSVLVTARGTNTLTFTPPATPRPSPVPAAVVTPTPPVIPTPANPVIAPTWAVAPRAESAPGVFEVQIEGPVPGVQVRLNGVDLGLTPLTGTLAKGLYNLELLHKDYAPFTQDLRPNAQGRVRIAPTLLPAGDLQVLVFQRDDLGRQRQKRLDDGFGARLWSGVFYGLAALGAGAAAYTYFEAQNLRKLYDAGTALTDFEGLRTRMAVTNTLFNVGLVSAGGGLALGFGVGLAAPGTGDLDARLESLNEQIRRLGGQ